MKNLTMEEYDAQEKEACKRWVERLSYICVHPSVSEEKGIKKDAGTSSLRDWAKVIFAEIRSEQSPSLESGGISS